MSFNGKIPLLACAAMLASLHCSFAQDVFIAGVEPDSRPVDAPRIDTFNKPADWSGRMMHGIAEPVPSGLASLDAQGAWYTPFNHHGMTGHYDIRNWHQDD
ncbi:MAG: hypothetical protein CMJ42_11580 [Phyllobacteriaceae bacterium]|nr:hypothetical protein [Phyllobacteriaceae bacterium]MBA90630.1 hypothetical protein [Phyllobacteriaceae bacterium]